MVQFCLDDVEISHLTNETSQAAFLLACKEFARASVLHTAVGVSVEEYQEYLQVSFESMWKQGLSLVATNRTNNELIGCLIACDYATQAQPSTSISHKLKPVNALLEKLDALYRENRQIDIGQSMLVDMAVVNSTAAGYGVYKKMREKVHQIGREAGFNKVIGELSSAATQHLCTNKLGHKICAEIEYASFHYLGTRPFAEIKEPPGIILVEGEL